jgi:Spy/CpxP family protein refolding chaperone
MRVQTKIGWVVLALALSCGMMSAQDGSRDSQASGRGGFSMQGPGDDGAAVLLGFEVGPEDQGAASGMAVEALAGSGGADARGPLGHDGRWGGEHGGHTRRMAMVRLLNDPEIREKAGISAEQVTKIRQQAAAFRKTEIQQRANLAVKRVDLRELLSADKPDRAAIDSKLQDISSSQLALEKARVGFRLDMKDAITPEQREKLRAAIRERIQGERGGAGRRGPGMRGGQRGSGAPGTPPAPDAQAKPGE